MMNQLDKIIKVHKNDFDSEDILAINYVKGKILKGYWIDKRME